MSNSNTPGPEEYLEDGIENQTLGDNAGDQTTNPGNQTIFFTPNRETPEQKNDRIREYYEDLANQRRAQRQRVTFGQQATAIEIGRAHV